jgi:TorA maturation chaperone TorD
MISALKYIKLNKGKMNRSMARSNIYNNLSLCYTYPNEDVCSWMMGMDWIEEMRKGFGALTDENFEEYFETFRKHLSGQKEEVSLEMSREYTRLFINGFPKVVAPPYGSVHLEKDGLVFGKTTSGVLQFYHEAGFTLKEDIGDLPDHIAHELEFMRILTGREAETAGTEKVRLEEIQMDFLSQYLLSWVPAFCKRIREESTSVFYRALADLTGEFMHLEKNYLGVPEEVNSHRIMDSEIRGG